MSMVGSFFNMIKSDDHNIKYPNTHTLSEFFRLFLDSKDKKNLDKLEKGSKTISEKDFEEIVKSFFIGIKFGYDSFGDEYPYFNDENILDSKENICKLFNYFDIAGLNDDYNFKFIEYFFEILEKYDDEETRVIYDLLTCEDIKNSQVMRRYLLKKDGHYYNNKYANFVESLYDVLDKVSDEDKEKIDYIFYSSYSVFNYFLISPNEMSKCLNSEVVSRFDKESLSLWFRNCDLFIIFNVLDNDDVSFIKTLSLINNYVLEKIGHNGDFFRCVMRVFNTGNSRLISMYCKILTDFYDEYYEECIKNDLDQNDVFNKLLSFVLDFDCIYFLDDNSIKDLDNLLIIFKDSYDKMYNSAFGKINFYDMKCGRFDLESYLNKKVNPGDLKNLKVAFFKHVYGININDAEYIVKKYGEFLDICEEDFFEEDHSTLEVLKAICNIYRISYDDIDKVREFKLLFCNYLKETGFYDNEKFPSFVILRALIDRMYMKTFNKVLFKTNESNILYYDDGVPIIDAGTDFHIIGNVINGVGEFFKKEDNFKVRYNTSNNSTNQGVCTSFISNESLGVVRTKGPLIAYDNFDVDTLAAMGVGDIFSDTDSCTSLRRNNNGCGEGKYFLTAKKLIDYTRYGYNEMVFDRFLIHDENNSFKIQPSYIVAYKIDDQYRDTLMYSKGVKMAKDFGIPLVLVDIPKVKENEKKCILEMEEQLFSNNKVDKDLMKAIITRYMNNYSGTLTICRNRHQYGCRSNYIVDFSVGGIKDFLDKVDKKMDTLSLDDIEDWYESLKECYELEKRKNKIAHDICSYADSLNENEFLLKDEIDFQSRIIKIREKAIDMYYLREGMVEYDKLSFNFNDNKMPEIDLIVELSNRLFDKAYVKLEDFCGTNIFLTTKVSALSEQDKKAYGLVISYLLGNYDENYFCDLDICNFDNLEFNPNTESLKNSIQNSNVFCDIVKTPLLDFIVDKVYNMDKNDFVNMFRPTLKFASKQNDISVKRLTDILIKRKNNVIAEFSKLPEKSKKKEHQKVKKIGNKKTNV